MIYRKYSGAGNTFLLFDNRNGSFPLEDRTLIRQLCLEQPKADGVILLSDSLTADFTMRIFNADGSEAEMCGNGIRCLYRFCQDLGVAKRSLRIQTLDGEQLLWSEGADVAVGMQDPSDIKWSLQLSLSECPCAFLNTGVPHLVHHVESLEHFPLDSFAQAAQALELFQPQSCNVNIVQIEGKQSISVRTYERGVGETLACGTGAVASALSAAERNAWTSPVTVTVASGDTLRVEFKPNFRNVTLIGPARRVSAGEILPAQQAIPASSSATP